jgi:hypothetical protein
MTIPDEPAASPTVTLAKTYTSITLCPVNLSPTPRDNAVVGIDGRVRRRSYASNTPTLFSAVKIEMFGTTCTAAEYVKLMKWAVKPVRVSLDDQDETCYVAAWTGMLTAPTSLNSIGKQSNYPSMTLIVENESANA